ncbi:hypothetical protein KKI24_01305 [bacterium]|nr:hypothetical protein [bacterium]
MSKKENKRAPRWADVEIAINRFDKKQLMGLIGDLYRLSPANKDFFHTRFGLVEDPLVPYKEAIQAALTPELEDRPPVEIDRATDVVNMYSKAVDNPYGMTELMVFYVECGNRFALKYEGVDPRLFEALLEMAEYSIEAVQELPAEKQHPYRDRLHGVMKSASGVGSEYYSRFCDLYSSAFPDEAKPGAKG